MNSTNPGRYLIFFLIKFLFECRKNHVWGSIFDPSYDHIHKNIHFGRKRGSEERRKEVRKRGREEERTRGRKEARKGGRKEEGRKEE